MATSTAMDTSENKTDVEDLTELDTPILIAFDIETSGSRLVKHAMLELGAVIMDPRTNKTLDTFEVMIAMPRGAGWEQRCLDEFWLKEGGDPVNSTCLRLKYQKYCRPTQTVLVPEGFEGNAEIEAFVVYLNKSVVYQPREAMHMFVDWINGHQEVYDKNNKGRIFFVTDTGSFDSMFVNYYLSVYASNAPLQMFFDNKYRDILNTGSYYAGLARVTRDDMWPHKKNANCKDKARASVRCEDKALAPHDHRAVHDAEHIGQDFCLITLNLRRMQEDAHKMKGLHSCDG